MAELPQMPPGIGSAVAAGTMVTPADILSGGIPPGTASSGNPAAAGTPAPVNAADAMTTVQGNIASSAADLQQSKSMSLTGASQVGAGAAGQAQGQQGINAADFMTLLTRQQRDAQVYSMWGTTPGSPSATVAAIASRISSEEVDVGSRREALQKKLDANFLDNPIQWLSNQITMPFDEAALNNRIQGRNDDLEVLHQLAMRTQEGVAADAAASYTMSTGRLAAMDTVAAAGAQVKAGESQMQAASTMVGAASTGNTIAISPYTVLANQQRLALETDQEGYQKVIAEQQNARANEQHIVQMDILNLNDVDLNKKVAAQTDLDARVRKLSAVTGANIVNYSQLTAMADGKQKQAILDMLWNPDIQQGMSLSVVGPAEAIDFANTMRLPLNPGQDLTRQKLTQDESAYIKSLGPTAKTLYTSQQLLINTNAYIKNKIQTELTAIPSTGGYYSPPSLLTSLSLPGMKDNPLAAALSPLANPQVNIDKNYPTDARDVTAAGMAMISSGAATPAQVADMTSKFYTTIMQMQDTTKGYRIFTLPTIGDKGTFNATIPSEGMFSSYATHNLANKAEMETYFTRMAIKQKLNPGQPTPVMTAPSNLPTSDKSPYTRTPLHAGGVQ